MAIAKSIVACFALLVAVPACAQSIKLSTLEEQRIDAAAHDTIVRSYRHVLGRGTINDPLSISFRISRVNNNYTLELKLMDAGSKAIVPKNALLKLYLEDGELQTLYNTDYTTVCRGCGAIGYNGADAPGIMLTYPLTHADVVALQRSYINKIRVYEADGYWYKKINVRSSELFMTYLDMVCNAYK